MKIEVLRKLNKKNNLPDKPGVYFFKKGKIILYIGKATSLNDRVKSYFSKDPEGKREGRQHAFRSLENNFCGCGKLS